MFLHILADTLGSLAVMISIFLIDTFGWIMADPVCSLFLSILIMGSVWPTMRSSALILLQRMPSSFEVPLKSVTKQVNIENFIYSYT